MGIEFYRLGFKQLGRKILETQMNDEKLMDNHRIVEINGEKFEVQTKLEVAEDWVDYGYLKHELLGFVASETLRDLFWNRYIGAVRAQLKKAINNQHPSEGLVSPEGTNQKGRPPRSKG